MSSAGTSRIRRAPLAVGISLALATGASQAATFDVTSNADAGAGTLRQAIIDANAAAGPHTINLAPIDGQTIVLESDLTDIGEAVDLVGSDVTLDGAGSYSCLYSTADLSVADMTITNCTGHDFYGTTFGGGIEVYGGDLTLEGSTVTDNSADYGGGVALTNGYYALTIAESTISGNASVDGGGILGYGPMNIVGSVISGNYAADSGGAIDASNGVSLSSSEVRGNTAYIGGGFNIAAGGVALESTTVADNSAYVFGAGYVYADYGAFGQTVVIDSSTISDNSAQVGGGLVAAIYNSPYAAADGGFTLTNSTISGNSAESGAGLYLGNVGFKYNYGNFEPTIEGATITGNSAANFGGGLTVFNSDAYSYGYTTTVAVDKSIIQGNSAGSGSGDLETGAAFGMPPGPGLAKFYEFVVENPERFERLVAVRMNKRSDPVRLDKSRMRSLDLSDTVVEFASRRLEVRGASSGVSFEGIWSIIGEAPTTGTFNPDTATADALGGDPQLGPLSDNGGPTFTHLPAEDSIAVELIPRGVAGCGSAPFNVDQRGYGRPSSRTAFCDVGSVERVGGNIAIPTLSKWGYIAMTLGLGLMGWLGIRRFRAQSTD
jgi:hypothetical protein